MDNSGVDAQAVLQNLAMKVAKLEVQNSMLEVALEKAKKESSAE